MHANCLTPPQTGAWTLTGPVTRDNSNSTGNQSQTPEYSVAWTSSDHPGMTVTETYYAFAVTRDGDIMQPSDPDAPYGYHLAIMLTCEREDLPETETLSRWVTLPSGPHGLESLRTADLTARTAAEHADSPRYTWGR